MNEALEYIQQSTDQQRKLFMMARTVILNASQVMKESFSYKVPFYSCYNKVCYLNKYKKGIDIGFVRGFELSDQEGRLTSAGRSRVKSLRIQDSNDFDEDLLRQTIQEAILLDELVHKTKVK